jgi:tol-pal system protein YbgF
MDIRRSLIAAALCAVLAVPAMADDDLETQVSAQQATMLRMQNALDQMQSQLDSQNGKIEELEHEISGLRSQLEAVQSQAQNSQEGEQQEGGEGQSQQQAGGNAQGASAAAAGGRVTDSKGNPLKPADANAKAMYSSAYKMVVANKLSDSIPAFKSFIQKYPDSELTPNAWYWLGQVQFKLKQNQDARVSFLNAAGFRNSPKRPDSLYKLGLIYKLSGDNDKAKRFFEVVAKQYPNDTAASLAKKQLAAN